MDPRLLPPIPTPPAQRWREVRLLYLPRAMFILGVIVAAVLWTRWVAPATLVAEAEVTFVEVRAAQAGVVASLDVALLQPVTAGQVIGRIGIANPRLLDATLAVIRSEVGMLSATMAGTTDRQRMAIEWERLTLESMNHRIDLAALKVRLQQAESELARAKPLQAAGLVTEETFEQLRNARNVLMAQIEEQGKLLAHLDPLLATFATPEAQRAALAPESALTSAIKVQEAKLQLAEAQLTPQPLVAPMAGVVSLLARRAGENVAAGDPVLRISATRSDRLVGYLRQPLSFEPKAGMTAEVATRTSARDHATTQIVEVGPAMEPISPSLLSAMHLPPNTPPEPGLRVHFAMPQGLNLRPGEHVDVTVH